MYSCYSRRISFEINSNSKEIRRAEDEYMNKHPPPPTLPISVLVTSLTLFGEQKIGTRWFFVKKLSFSQDSKRDQSRFWSLFVSSELPKTLPFV